MNSFIVGAGLCDIIIMILAITLISPPKRVQDLTDPLTLDTMKGIGVIQMVFGIGILICLIMY
jgi:hypothetical protein